MERWRFLYRSVRTQVRGDSFINDRACKLTDFLRFEKELEALRKELAASTAGSITPNVDNTPNISTVALDGSSISGGASTRSHNRDSGSFDAGSPLLMAASSRSRSDVAAPEQISPIMLAADEHKVEGVPSTTGAMMAGGIDVDALELPESIVQRAAERKKDV